MKKWWAHALVSVAVVVGLAGPAGLIEPAHADRDSPRPAVEKFWDRVGFGQGSKAVLSFKRECRSPRLRRAFLKMSRDVSRILRDTPFFLGVKAYDEQVNGRFARTTYWLTLTDLESYEEKITVIRGQHWVRIDDRWFIDCRRGNPVGRASVAARQSDFALAHVRSRVASPARMP